MNDLLLNLNRLMNDVSIKDELTIERIRTIYVQANYGNRKIYEIAAYYNLPVEIIKDIRDGLIFPKITEDLKI